MYGVKFGEKHSYEDWGLILTSKTINFPDPKIETVDIPGANGELDFTEALTGDVPYKNRKLTFNFSVKTSMRSWQNLMSSIANYLHGKKLKIVLDQDNQFYYYGRAELSPLNCNKSIGRITITCDAEPYKYDVFSSLEDWKWDTFNFETGIINRVKNIRVYGEQEVVITGRKLKVVPEIQVSNPIIVEFENKQYQLQAGKQKVLNIEIVEGENILKFIGKGIVNIDYRGGCL